MAYTYCGESALPTQSYNFGFFNFHDKGRWNTKYVKKEVKDVNCKQAMY